MRFIDLEIEGVEYRFIPSKCLIYPKVSTDVIVDRWVHECFDITPGVGVVKLEDYYKSYLAWGGNLSKPELTRTLLRLGYDAKRRATVKGRSALFWVGVKFKEAK